MDQYIHDNTDDEKSHASFLNNYLMSKGEAPVSHQLLSGCPAARRTVLTKMHYESPT